MRYDIRHFGEVLAQNIIFYGGFSKDWGNQTSYATEMDLFLVTAATICTDGVLGGRWLCCFNEGIVLLLWMDKKRKTFRALLNFAFVSNLSCRAYIYPPWLPSRTTCICLWWRSISFLWPLRQYLLENTGQTAIEMVRCFDWNCPKLKRCAMIWGTEHWTALSVGFPAHIWYKTTQICWVAEMGGLS